jgi:hypothetical protein
MAWRAAKMAKRSGINETQRRRNGAWRRASRNGGGVAREERSGGGSAKEWRRLAAGGRHRRWQRGGMLLALAAARGISVSCLWRSISVHGIA